MDKYIFIKKNLLDKQEIDHCISIVKDSTTPSHNNYYYGECEDLYSKKFEYLYIKISKCMGEYIKKHSFLQKTHHPWGLDRSFNLQKYLPGMSYSSEHMEHGKDSFDSKRLLVWMINLNTIRDGGQTEWPQQRFKIKPKAGTLTIWPAGWTHSHRGIISKTETKYIMTGWCSFL